MDFVYTLRNIVFEWDEAKAASNFSKHKVTFDTACEVFFDPFLLGGETEFIEGEQREIVIGATAQFRLLYVAYTIRGESIRVISARLVTKPERIRYEDQ